VEAFLATMDPQADNVGLAILPPAKHSASVCSSPQSSNYDDINAPYVVVPLSNDYETSSGALDPSSRLVSTLRCVQAGGQTAYANALVAHGRPGVQKVIVILSDGAANTGPTYLSPSSPYRTQPCQTAVNIANQRRSRRPATTTPSRSRHR
jgi:hypothetical protein